MSATTTCFTSADRLNNSHGENVSPRNARFHLRQHSARAVDHRHEIPGRFRGRGWTVAARSINSVKAGGFDSHFGIGDFFVEGTLSWHPKQFDSRAYLRHLDADGRFPSKRRPPPTRAGLGYWTPMLTAGATWYVDAEKKWAVSALSRYEFNPEKQDTHITPGQAYTLEWGAAQNL